MIFILQPRYILCFKYIGLFSSLRNESSSSKKYKPVEDDEDNGK